MTNKLPDFCQGTINRADYYLNSDFLYISEFTRNCSDKGSAMFIHGKYISEVAISILDLSLLNHLVIELSGES